MSASPLTFHLQQVTLRLILSRKTIATQRKFMKQTHESRGFATTVRFLGGLLFRCSTVSQDNRGRLEPRALFSLFSDETVEHRNRTPPRNRTAVPKPWDS